MMRTTTRRGWSRSLLLPALTLALAGPAAAGEGEPARAAAPPAPPARVAPASPAAPAPSPAPAALAPRSVDFRSALKAAEDSSPELEAARARIEQARWGTEQAWAAGNPTVGIEVGYTHLDPEVAGTLMGRTLVVSPADSYKAALTLRQAVATFGRLHYGVLAGQMAERAAREDYRQRLATQLTETADNYLLCLLAAEEVRISEQRLATREASMRDAEALFEAGTVARFDVLRVRSAATQARQLLIEARNAQKLAKARLASKMGLPTGTELELAAVGFDTPPPQDMDPALQQALARRPEVLSLGWAVEAARARLGLAESQDNPMLSLQTQYYGETKATFAPDQQWATGLVLSVPLYDGGASRAQAGQAREAMRELSAGLEAARRAVRLDVESAFLNLASRWERIAQARQGLEEATEAARVAEVRYTSGLSTSTELLDAQTALVQAQQALAAARYGYLGAAVSWNRAISGEYPVEVPGPLAPAGDSGRGAAPVLLPPSTSEGSPGGAGPRP